MNHYQDQAAAAIKRKDYKTALQHYNKALSRAESATLYDARAACHIRLDDLPAALKDAKKCIQLAKVDPTGYLRAGKLLMEMNKKSVALEVMAHGLRTVKHAGQSYETLKSAHNSLMEEIKPSKSVDPMTVLPRELAINILEQLDFRQRVNACSVSKAWNGFIRSVPELWEHLDFSRAKTTTRGRVKRAFVVQAIKTARTKIRRVTLNNMANFEDSVELLVRHCPLEGLTFEATPKLPENFAHMLRPASNLKSLHFTTATAQTCRLTRHIFETFAMQLEEFSIKLQQPQSLDDLTSELSLPKLRVLDLMSSCVHSSAVWTRMPALQSLCIRQESFHYAIGITDACCLTALGQLQNLDIVCDAPHFSTMIAPKSLKTIKILILGMPQDRWPSLALPALEKVEIRLFNPQSLELVTTSLTAEPQMIPSLRRFSINHIVLPSTLQQFRDFCAHPAFKTLEHIGLPEVVGRSDYHIDDCIDIMIEKFPMLSSMDLSSTEVTGVGVQSALKGAFIEHLTLDNCSKLGLDAVYWARSKGIRVSNRSLEALQHERKVRQL